jgi:Ca2+-binding EF-hand superfamily protein
MFRNANFSISDAFNLFCPAYCGCIQPADLAAFYQKHGNCVSAHDVELLLARFESNQQSGISYQNFVRELLPLHP